MQSDEDALNSSPSSSVVRSTKRRKKSVKRDGILQRGNTYYVVLREPDPVSGKTKPVWHSGFSDREAAEEFRDDRRRDLKRNMAVPKANMTLSHYLERWLADHAVSKPLKRTTHASYAEKIRNYVDPTIGQMQLQMIRPHHLKAWTADLMRGGGKRTTGLSPATVRKVGVIVKEALVAAVEEYGYLRTNPAANLKLPKPKRRVGTIWTVEEAQRFASTAAEHRLTTLFTVLIATGARRGECLALTWDDIDLEAGLIRISKGVTWVNGVREVSSTKTDEVRVVPIDPRTVTALKAHRARQAQERLACASWQEGDLVFSRPDGSALPPDFAYRQFVKLVAAAGVPKIRLHDLRHTHATWLLEAGEQLHVVAERLGHADSSTTSTIYAHVTGKQRRSAAETFQRIVEGP